MEATAAELKTMLQRHAWDGDWYLRAWNDDGVAIGTATVFDRLGPIGTSTVTSLANAKRSVDFTQFDAQSEHATHMGG